MNQGGALTVLARAGGGDHGGDAGTDVLTQDDRDGHTEVDGTRGGQSLKDTDGGGGGLNDGGEDGTGQHAQDGIGKHGQDLGEIGIALEAADSPRHEIHTHHQNGEAHENGTSVLMLALLGEHDEADTDESQDGHPGIGLEPLRPCQGIRAALNTVQSGEPGGDGGTDIGTHDDTYGLLQQHGTRVDEAHDHNGGGGGGLDDGGDDEAKTQRFKAIGGQIAENGLELASRALFQRVAHDVHTIQEQRETAYQCQYVKDSHVITFL